MRLTYISAALFAGLSALAIAEENPFVKADDFVESAAPVSRETSVKQTPVAKKKTIVAKKATPKLLIVDEAADDEKRELLREKRELLREKQRLANELAALKKEVFAEQGTSVPATAATSDKKTDKKSDKLVPLDLKAKAAKDDSSVLEVSADGKATIVKPQDGTTIEVSNQPYEYNQLNFSQSVAQVLFPPRVPLGKIKTKDTPEGATVAFLSDNKSILFWFSEIFDKPFKIKAELEDGTIQTLTLIPKPIGGVVKQVASPASATKVAVAPLTTKTATVAGVSSAVDSSVNGADEVALMRRLVMKDASVFDEYQALPLPSVTTFDRFVAVPVGKWGNGAKNILKFQLVSRAGAVSKVDAHQFYREGVLAAMLQGGDTISEGVSPFLYVIEQVPQR